MQFSTITDFPLTVVRIVLLPDFVQPVTVQCGFDAINQVITVQDIRSTDLTGIA